MEQQTPQKKESGWWVLWMFLGLFSVFLSVDAYFVYMALSTHTGLVVENAYEVGLNYNEIIEKAEELNKTKDSHE